MLTLSVTSISHTITIWVLYLSMKGRNNQAIMAVSLYNYTAVGRQLLVYLGKQMTCLHAVL